MKNRIYIHPLLPPLLILISLIPQFKSFFVFYLFIFLHELSHMFAAVILKEAIHSIKLLPWGCMLCLKSTPKAKKSLIIFLAGSLFNILMYFLNIFPSENLSLAFFNLMPVIPLDGGVICRIIFGKFYFIPSLGFVILTVFLCWHFSFPFYLPVVLFILLLIGEKNQLDESVYGKIMNHFNNFS